MYSISASVTGDSEMLLLGGFTGAGGRVFIEDFDRLHVQDAQITLNLCLLLDRLALR